MTKRTGTILVFMLWLISRGLTELYATAGITVYFSSSTGPAPFSPSYSTSAAAGFAGSETKLSMNLPSEIGYLNSYWVEKANPYANESVLIAQSTSAQLTTRYWDGSSWQTPAGAAWWGTGGVVGIKQFDLAYFENDPTYRRGMTVYGNSTSAPAFRIWFSTASGWGVAGNTSMSARTYRWIRLEPVPATNKVVCVALSTTTINLVAAVYDLDTGSWGAETILADSSKINGGNIGTGSPRIFDLAIGNSGKAMVVWVDDSNTASLSYSTWTAAGGWAAAPISLGYTIDLSTKSQWVRLAAKPGSDEIQLVANKVPAGTTTRNLYAVTWDGSSWVNGASISGNTTGSAEQRFDVNYERASGDCLIVFSSSTNTPPSYVTRLSGAASWSAVAQATDFGASAQGKWYRLAREESLTSDDVYLMANCADNSVKWQKWSGTSWGAVTTVETNSLSTRQAFDMNVLRSLTPLFDITAPSAISDLTASNSGLNDSEIKLQWTAPGDDGASGAVSGYLVKYSSMDIITTAGFATAATYYQTWNGLAAGGNAESRTLTGFTPGTTYWFAVKGYDDVSLYGVWNSSNDIGGYNTAASTSAQDLDPQVPQGLAAASGGYDHIDLSWTASTDIDLYRYELASSSWSETDGFTVATATVLTSYSHTDLVGNNTYYYKLRAKDNTDHYSAYSSTVSTYPVQVPPAAPTGFDGLVLSTTAIKWSWTDNAGNEDGYRVKSDTDGIMGVLGPVAGGATDYTETDLTPNTSYYRYAEAHNTAGTSSTSARTYYTLPDKPLSLQATAVTTNTVTLTWGAGVGGANRYGLARSTDDFTTSISSFVVFGNNLTANTTAAYDLLVGTTYYFRVWAYNADGGESAWDGPASTRTKATSDYMNLVISEIMYNPQGSDTSHEWVEVYNRSGMSIDLTGWKFFDGDGTTKHSLSFFQGGTTIPAGGYAVLVDSATAFLGDYAADPSSGTWMIVDTVVDLANNNDTAVLYYGDSLTVISTVSYANSWNNNVEGRTIDKLGFALTENDPASWQESSYAKGSPGGAPDGAAPGDVSNLSAANTGLNEGEIKLDWTAPGDDGAGGKVSGYLVKYSSMDIITTAGFTAAATYYQTWSGFASGGGAESRTLTGFTPGTTYWFAAEAYDEVGRYGVWSSSNDIGGYNTTSAAAAQDLAPQVPQGLTAVPGGSTQVTVSWSANTDIDFYFYELTSSSWSETEGFTVATATVLTSYSHTDLAVNNTYYYILRAKDNTGHYSAYSSAVSTYPVQVPPAAPTGFDGLVLSTTSIRWSWTDNATNEDGYRVKSDTDGIMGVLGPVPGGTTDYTEAGLLPNTSYYRYAEAHNSIGASSTPARTYYTLPDKPVSLQAISATTGAVTLSWSAGTGGANRYGLARSTDDFITGVSSFVVFSNGLTENTTAAYDLLEGTTYYFRVWAYNADGGESAWDGPASTRTDTLAHYMDLVINEIMYNPQGSDTAHEWLEIYNRSAGGIDLTGWKFFDGDGTTKHSLSFFQGGTTIPAGGYAVLVDSTTAFLNDYAADPSSGTWLIVDTVADLSNTADTAVLYYRDSATVISTVTYSSAWNGGVEGRSIEKTGPGAAENAALSWQASSAAGGSPGAKNSGVADAVPPEDISDLTAAAGEAAEGTVILSWTAPGDDGATGPLGNGSQYKLWASTNPISFAVSAAGGGTGTTDPVSWERVISTTAIPNAAQAYTAAGLYPGTTYYFALRTKDPSGNWSAWPGTSSSVNTNSSAAAYDTYPAKPAGLVLTPGTGRIVVDWGDNTEQDVTVYRVHFGMAAGVYDHADSPRTAAASSITLSGLTNSVTYYIAVRAVDAKGRESALSDEQHAYPGLEAPSWTAHQAVPGCTDRLYWEWSSVPNAANGYRVYTSTNGLLAELGPSTTYWTETGLTANAQYSRYVRGVDPGGEGYGSPAISRYTFAGKPEHLSPSQQTVNSITLIWNPPSDGGAPAQYVVERNGADIATVSALTYADGGISMNTEYAYRVKSLNGDGLTDAVSMTAYTNCGTASGTAPEPEGKFVVPGKEIKFGTEAEEVRIYDRQGREIIRKGKGTRSFITWDGKSGGGTVESGAYIYQIKTKSGKKRFGTIIIAK